jgi:hypothetical protein
MENLGFNTVQFQDQISESILFFASPASDVNRTLTLH